MDRAFSITLGGRPIGAATAAAQLATGAIPDAHDFLCADPLCRKRRVRVLLVAAGRAGDVLPHFRTCTRMQDCLVKMGLPKTAQPTAEELHDPECEFYDRPRTGPKTGTSKRTVGDERIILKSGTPLRLGRPRTAPLEQATPRIVAPSPVAAQREENQHSKLFGLVDSLKHWRRTELADHLIVLNDAERTIEELCVDAGILDGLSFDRQRRAKRRSGNGQETDLTEQPHVFFGSAVVRVVSNGAVRVAFDGGINLELAFEPSPAPTVVPLSLFIDDALLKQSKKQRTFRDDLRAAGVSADRNARCCAFVLGRLKCLTLKGYLNVEPLGTTEDIVLLPEAEASNFRHLRDYLHERRDHRERERMERIRISTEAKTHRREGIAGPERLAATAAARAEATTRPSNAARIAPAPSPVQADVRRPGVIARALRWLGLGDDR